MQTMTEHVHSHFQLPPIHTHPYIPTQTPPPHIPSPPLTPQLIIGDANLELFVSSIAVQGRLRLGHPNCRLQSQIRLTFSAVSGMDIKQLGIQVAPGGAFDAFGVVYTPTWTRLAATANPGDARLQLQVGVGVGLCGGWECMLGMWV